MDIPYVPQCSDAYPAETGLEDLEGLYVYAGRVGRHYTCIGYIRTYTSFIETKRHSVYNTLCVFFVVKMTVRLEFY